MAFQYRKGHTDAVESEIIANSQTLRVGEAVSIDTDGFVVTCPAGSAVYGVVQGFTGPTGEVPTTNGAGGDFDPYGDFAVASDNETVAKYKAQIQISKKAIYSAAADDTLGTTTGSDLRGYKMDHIAGALTLDENTATTGSAQWVSHGIDPEDSTRVLVSIYEHALDA